MFSNSDCCSLLELLEGDILVDKEEDNNVVENERALAKTEFGWLRRQGERQVGKGRALLSSSGRVGETSCSEGELSTKSSTSPSSPSRIVEFRLRFTFAGSGRDFGTLAVHRWKKIGQELVSARAGMELFSDIRLLANILLLVPGLVSGRAGVDVAIARSR